MKTEVAVSVVVIDDDPIVCRAVTEALKREGHKVQSTRDPLEGIHLARDKSVDVVVSDIRMPNVSGLDVLRQLKQERPELEIILMTGHATVETALEAVKAGAYDFLLKPFERIEQLTLAVKHAAERQLLRRRASSLEHELETRDRFEGMLGQSPAMSAVFRMVSSVGPSTATVLIQGESGTGKELVARALHHLSPRKQKAFIAVNCSALPETLVDSELFGHVKGAFTGATEMRKGLFEAAHGGTLFLDEIGDIPPATQVRLLRVLQEGEIKRVGSNDIIKVDVRVVAATHVSLEEARAKGEFRDDLYYRLSVIPITLPSLRDRPEDVPLLAQHFLKKSTHRAGKSGLSGFSPEVLDRLVRYRWPGNVRELENLIERVTVLSSGPTVELEALPQHLQEEPKAVGSSLVNQHGLLNMPFSQAKALSVAAFERWYLTSTIERSGGNISAAAIAAGMDRSNFRRLLKEHSVRGSREDQLADEKVS